MECRPIINHIHLVRGSGWITRIFLPLFDDQLAWCEDVRCGLHCPLACYPHLLVQDELQKNMYHKLCTLTVIKAGLVTRKEILEATES
jgi:hypothetical protein